MHDQFTEVLLEMIGEIEIPAMMRKVENLVRDRMGAEVVTVYMVESDTHELVSVKVLENISQVIRVPLDTTSLSGFCAATGRSFFVPDAYDDLSAICSTVRFDRRWDERTGFRTKDVLCVPAKYKGKVEGVIQVINRTKGTFSKTDLAPLEDVCKLIGYTIYNARLYEEINSLKQLKKREAEYMRILVHELRSPIASAKMSLSALQYLPKDDPRIADFLKRIGKRLDHLLSLVADVMDLSAVKSGEPLSDIVVFDLVEKTKDNLPQHRDVAEGKGLRFVMDLCEIPLPVRMDPKAYYLILSNVLSNAVKYTEEGQVTIKVAEREGYAVLEVSDTGIGIPEDAFGRMFSEFFRAANAKKKNISGTGVGLAGVKELVERFGGRLGFESTEGTGSMFTIMLKLYASSGDP